MADAVFRVSVRGAGRVAREFNRAQRALQNAINDSVRSMGERAADVLYEDAPKDTEAMADSIRVTTFFRAARPHAQVTIEPDARGAGVDYLTITRRGHRQRIITSRSELGLLSVHFEGRDGPAQAMRSVRGYRPVTDWVNVAEPTIDIEAEDEFERLGRRIDTRVLR